jgi:hypothetical protein
MVKAMKSSFHVIATRSQGWWALTFPGRQGWFSQGRDEAEVEFMAKDLIHNELGIPLEEIQLDIEYREKTAVGR